MRPAFKKMLFFTYNFQRGLVDINIIFVLTVPENDTVWSKTE